jgi:hypothetical protein
MDYGSPEPLPIDLTNGDFPGLPIFEAVVEVPFGAIPATRNAPVTRQAQARDQNSKFSVENEKKGVTATVRLHTGRGPERSEGDAHGLMRTIIINF